MAQIPSVEELVKAGVHFGHRSEHWHPKMKQFIFGIRKGVHVVDVEKTQTQLESAMRFVSDITAKGGIVLFVGTKRQAQESVAAAAKACGMPYVTSRWLGGTLTNWPQIQRLLRHYLGLKDKRDKGELKKYTKLEQLNFDREIAELDEKIGGVSTLTRMPDALFVVDARNEKTVIREAQSVGLPVVALVDTNVNPNGVAHVIPGNDDAVSSIALIANLIAQAVKEGKAKVIREEKKVEEKKI
jgi:small subunit ribosomal protein S2